MNIVYVLGIIGASHGVLAEVAEDVFEMEEGELILEGMLRGLSSLMRTGSARNMESSHMSSLTSHMLHLAIICLIQVAPADFMSIRRPDCYTKFCTHHAIDSVWVGISYDPELGIILPHIFQPILVVLLK